MATLRHWHQQCLTFTLCIALASCGEQALNNPHTDYADNENIRYAVFTESPKTLDPARSYSSNEIRFTAQIVEPLLQYDYLKRPYALTPLIAAAMPTVSYIDQQGNPLTSESSKVAYTIYDIKLKQPVVYQPHPAFAKDEQGNFRYHALNEEAVDDIFRLSDFKHSDTRVLTAHDYAYQIKRLASPQVRSPIYGLMSEHIVGLKEANKQMQALIAQQQKSSGKSAMLDLRDITLTGVEVITDNHLRIKIHGQYAQFIYWLAMPFFSPVPWEVDLFYQQAVLQDKDITLDWYPIGTGPYLLEENNPNSRMVLARNPHFRHQLDPSTHSALPHIDKHVFTLEKESIPQWTKFLQGYYDFSGISADSFDSAIQIAADGQPSLTPLLKERGIRLYTTVEPGIFYMGFNMLDEVVGGTSDTAQKLRAAIQKTIDYEEYISIFLNGRGIAANGPIPPGIFGYQPPSSQTPYAEKLQQAKKLMQEAGYGNGIDPKTKQSLILSYDVPASAGPGEKAVLNWMRKQFAKIGIQLHVRATQYNRFQEKMRTGNAQIFSWGWSADYPDPENFLFLFYGPNGKVKFGGENASNYQDEEFDRLFEKMRDLPNSPARQQLIDAMVTKLQAQTTWVWGFHPKRFELSHDWIAPFTPNAFANNTLQYLSLDPEKRIIVREQWNKPLRWPGVLLAVALLLFFAPIIWQYRRRGQQPAIKRVKSC